MADRMDFPATVEEFMEQYKIIDTEGVYTNGIELVPIFRMKQWFDRHPPADVVQVCRCKDCRKCSYDPLFNYYWCNLTLGTRRVKSDDFCSHGKRREEEE